MHALSLTEERWRIIQASSSQQKKTYSKQNEAYAWGIWWVSRQTVTENVTETKHGAWCSWPGGQLLASLRCLTTSVLVVFKLDSVSPLVQCVFLGIRRYIYILKSVGHGFWLGLKCLSSPSFGVLSVVFYGPLKLRFVQNDLWATPMRFWPLVLAVYPPVVSAFLQIQSVLQLTKVLTLAPIRQGEMDCYNWVEVGLVAAFDGICAVEDACYDGWWRWALKIAVEEVLLGAAQEGRGKGLLLKGLPTLSHRWYFGNGFAYTHVTMMW